MLHHKVAVRDERGNIVKWHGSSIDIEDRKRAEEELQQSQFYLAEGSALPTWEVGRSTQLDSSTGPPSCFGSMVLIRVASRQQ